MVHANILVTLYNNVMFVKISMLCIKYLKHVLTFVNIHFLRLTNALLNSKVESNDMVR